MYKKSIFGQMFSFTVLVFVISFCVIGTLLYGFLGEYLTERNEDDLNSIADKLAEMTLAGKNNESALYQELYQLNLSVISSSTGTFIIILDKDGGTAASSGENINVTVRPEFTQNVLEGKPEKFIGNLGGLFNTTMLTVAKPIMLDGGVDGAVFVNLPIPEIHQIRSDVFRIFLLSVCFVVFVALIFIYMLSNRLTKPIKEINNAAKSIAGGDFARRVSVDAENEIGGVPVRVDKVIGQRQLNG